MDREERGTLDGRLVELCQQEQRVQAKLLAKAVFANESIEDVTIDGDAVRVETSNFRGVHPLSTDGDGTFSLQREGSYTYTGDSVDLSFSSAAKDDRIRDRVRARLSDDSDGVDGTSDSADGTSDAEARSEETDVAQVDPAPGSTVAGGGISTSLLATLANVKKYLE